MYIEQLYTNCLAEAAYYIESEGVAAVIDPIRESEPYLELAKKRGATIKYIFETHFHADFVSGHLDLAKKTGATIVYGPTQDAKFEIHSAHDGEIFELGNITIKALHTPGHTPESTCYLLFDQDGKEYSIFTGDTLFVGDVGRPDLLDGVIISKEEQLKFLYETLNKKIKTLPDHVIVYPGHGPGSMCGKSIGKETQSTIGNEKRFNYALQDMSFEKFSEIILADQLPAPQYFVKNAIINRTGYEPIDEVLARNVRPLNPTEAELEIESGALVLDVRNVEDFEKLFVKGSMNIALNGSYAVWAGTLIDIKQRLVIVTYEGKERESILRLARVGYENVAGYLQGGAEAWQKTGKATDKVQTMLPKQFAEILEKGNLNIIDVRRTNEFKDGHLVDAQNIPLRDLQSRLYELDKNKTYYVHCAGGYRSMVASSILKANGYSNIVNVDGGFGAISKENVKTATGLVGA